MVHPVLEGEPCCQSLLAIAAAEERVLAHVSTTDRGIVWDKLFFGCLLQAVQILMQFTRLLPLVTCEAVLGARGIYQLFASMAY